ncbi:MAG: hypothetical protein ACJAXX_002572 [Roseivirga sp.]|jgi:hypothetical protein
MKKIEGLCEMHLLATLKKPTIKTLKKTNNYQLID